MWEDKVVSHYFSLARSFRNVVIVFSFNVCKCADFTPRRQSTEGLPFGDIAELLAAQDPLFTLESAHYGGASRGIFDSKFSFYLLV